MDEQALNELLECSVCLERLDHTSKVLPCQHTFCRRCLDEIVCTKKELRCPECRTLVSYRVEDLPANILLIRLLEGLKHANNQIVSSSSSTGAFKAKPPSRRHESLNTNLSHTSASKRQFDAKALYNYDAKEPGDLSFKKGEIITVCRQIDPNWYYGELNGKAGYFPSSYVQVVSTFSSSVPQVKALYDFDIKDENEKDCLKFQKDEILQLIRKVDDNWLEGRRGDKIGIFPLSFVELNDAAKSLVASRSRSSSSSSSVGVCDGVPSGTSSSSSNSSRSSAPPPGVRLPSSSFQQIWHPLPQQRDRVALHPPTPNTAAANAAASLPPSPLNASTSAQQKRHSFTATSHTHSANSSPTVQQRRSLELSPTSGTMPPTSPLHVALPPPPAPSCSGNVGSASAMKLLAHLESSGQIADDNKPGSTEANPPDIPFGKTAIYSALYNYKPQKEDEVELRKGDYYTVTEKCQDGWYKGHCLKTGVNGVFPGNYVQISRQSVGFVPVNPNLRGKELPSSSSIASADINSPPGSVFYGSPPPPPCSGNMDTPPPAPPPATVSQPHIRAVGSSSSSHGTSNSSTNLHRPSASGTTARSRALHHGSSVSSTSSSILASAYHSNNNNSCSGSSGNTGVGSGSALSPSVSSSILAAAYSNNNNNNNSSVGVISGSNLSTSVSSSSSQLSSSSTTHAIVDTPGSKSHSGPGGNTSASSLKNTASMGGCGVAGGHHAQNLNPSSSSSSHRNVADFAALQHSMSASANITPPNVVAGISSTATSHSTSKEKKEKKDKDKPSLVKRLTMGKGKKSKSPSEGEDPVVTLSSDTSHTTGHTRYRCIAPYPPQGEMELELKTGDIVLVYKKWEDGWFKGALQRTGKNGLFPGSFVTKCD